MLALRGSGGAFAVGIAGVPWAEQLGWGGDDREAVDLRRDDARAPAGAQEGGGLAALNEHDERVLASPREGG